MSTTLAPYIEDYVSRLLDHGVLFSTALQQALREIPLHLFTEEYYEQIGPREYRKITVVPDSDNLDQLDTIYSGKPLLATLEGSRPGRRTLPAEILAYMLESLDLEKSMKILEVGSPTGYVAALLAEIVGDQQLIFVMDVGGRTVNKIKRGLARAGLERINVVARDAFYGWYEYAPYDRILITAGCADISPYWMAQLKSKGFLLAPMSHGGWFPLVRLWIESNRIFGKVVGSAGATIDDIRGELYIDSGIRRRVATMRADIIDSPIWSGILERGPTGLRDFWFYIGIRSDKSCAFNVREHRRVVARGVGLDCQEDGWGIIASGVHRLLGTSKALQELDVLYREWEDLGMPRMADYRIELATKATGIESSHAWIIKREFHYQRIWVDRN